MKVRKFFPLFCFVMSFLLFAGCGSSDNPTPPPPTPAVSPQPAVVGAGQTLQFTTNITGSAVNWTVSGSSGGTINAQGVYTAPAATQNTTATVSATSMSDPAVTASATVNIIAAG